MDHFYIATLVSGKHVWIDELHLLCFYSGSASFEGPGLCILRFLLTVSAVVKWDGRAFGAFFWLRHQMFYPYVTISATQARKSDDLPHTMWPISLFFFGRAKNPGICEAMKDSGASSKKREKKAAFVGWIKRSLRIGTAQLCDVIGLQMLLRRMQTLEMRHS